MSYKYPQDEEYHKYCQTSQNQYEKKNKTLTLLNIYAANKALSAMIPYQFYLV